MMNRRADILFKYLPLLLMMGASFIPVFAQESNAPDQVKMTQITTHPDVDLAPRISPDGKWMAYVSKQTENYDIWIRNLETGRSRQMTDHQADDLYPVWDKKNRYIIFVSQRSDAKGDIYRLNLRNVRGELIAKGDPERLTTYMGFDGFPSISEFDEHIAWVSDRTGTPEIWFMTKRGMAIRQLTHGGATHPAWSPKQPYLAFTSFRQEGGHGDIWLVNLYAARDLVDTNSPTDSLERPMWPVTRGSAADGFPTWSPDAKTILFSRNELDDNGDGIVSPSDRAVIWAVDVSYLPEEHRAKPNPSFLISRDSFNESIAHAARPIISASYNAVQPEYAGNHSIYFVSSVKGNQDIFSFPDSTLRRYAVDPRPYFDRTSPLLPLPAQLNSRKIHDLLAEFDPWTLTAEERSQLWDRILAFHTLMDNHADSSRTVAESLYEIAVSYYLLGFTEQCRKFLHFINEQFPDISEQAAYAELLELEIQHLANGMTSEAKNRILFADIEQIRGKYTQDRLFAAQSLVLIGDIHQALNQFDEAASVYQQVSRDFSDFPTLCAESLIRLGVMQKNQNQLRASFLTFTQVMQSFPEQRTMATTARDEILDLLTKGAADDDALLVRYKLMIQQFSQYDLFIIEPFFRIAELYSQRRDYAAALETYDFILARFEDMPEETFKAHMSRAEVLLKMGELLQATRSLNEVASLYRSAHPRYAESADKRYTEILYNSARELMSAQNYSLAAAQFRRILEVNPHHIPAHQGYIECRFFMNEIIQVIAEYNELNKTHADDNILLYAQGLAYSYKGAPTVPGGFGTDVADADALLQSNRLLQKALTYDYNLIEAFLALSYNNEMLENYQNRQQNKPKSFWRKAGGTITAPVVWLFHTITFYEEIKPPQYYESAIQELTRALALNDERQNPRMEAMLALNMANNYYNLGEYGFRKAYDFYHTSLHYDSTFAGPMHEVLIKERMGHCSIFVNDQGRGPLYLKRTIDLYRQLNNEQKLLLNTKRLALLYEVGENSSDALQYYLRAADVEKRLGRFDGLMRSYRSAALHYFKLNQREEAVTFANMALELLESGQVPRKKSNPIYMQIGILDLYFPFPYDLRKVGAKSTIDLSTEEEEAFIYTILAQAFQDDKMFDEAVAFYQKKFQIYELRHDYDAQAVFQNNMGYLYFLKGDYDNAWRMFTNSYWWCVKTKYIYGQLLNLENAAEIVLTIAREDRPENKSSLQKYRNWITGKLAELLKLTQEDQAIYATSHTHFYMLLADLNSIPLESESTDLAGDLQNSYSMLEKAARTNEYLDSAEQLAQEHLLNPELSGIYFRRGDAYLRYGEQQTALDFYFKSRNLGLQHRLTDLVWQIDNSIGMLLQHMQADTLRERPLRLDPSYYFSEAIRVLETDFTLPPGLTAAHFRKTAQQPYRNMISRLISQGAVNEALAMAERMREKTYRDILGESVLVLQTDEHQSLYLQADSLKKEIERQELELLGTTQQSKAASREKSERLAMLQDDYANLLEVIRRKASEIESLIKISPTDLEQVQSLLRESEGILYQFSADQRSYLWLITRNAVSLHELPADAPQLYSWMQTWKQAAQSASIDSITTLALKVQIQGLPISGLQHLVVIPEYDWLAFPWSALFETCQLPQVETISSSLTSYYSSSRNLKTQHHRIMVTNGALADSLRKNSQYQILTPFVKTAETAAVAQLQNLFDADILHLDGSMFLNPTYPSYTRFQYDSAQTLTNSLSPLSLYGISSTTSLVTMNINNPAPTGQEPEPLIAWERSLFYSGVSSLLTSLWPAEDSTFIFYSHFYQNLEILPPAQALQKTQKDLSEMGLPPHIWAGYQLYGSSGVGNDEEQQNLIASSVRLTQSGDAAFRRGQWAEAVKNYSEALQLVAVQSAALTEDISSHLLMSAVNGGFWDIALKLQMEHIAAYSRRNQWDRVAAATMQLYVFHLQQRQEAKAADALQRYRQLCRAYGIDYDDASPFVETAQLFRRGANYEQAVQLYMQAAERYGRLKQPRRQIESLFEASRLLDDELGFIPKAVEVYNGGINLAEKGEFSDLQINGLLSISRACLHLENYAQSFSFLQAALNLAKTHNDPQLLDSCRVTLAQYYEREGDLTAAEDALNAVDEMLSSTKAPNSSTLLLMSRIKSGDGDVASAQRLAERAITQARRVEDIETEQAANETLGILSWMLGNHQQAILNLETTLNLESGPFARRESIQRRLVLSACYLDAGRAEQAAQTAREILQTCRESRLRDFLPVCLLIISQATADADSGAYYAEQALHAAGELHQWPVITRAHGRLAGLLAEDHPETALEHFKKGLAAAQMIRPQPVYYDNAAGLFPYERRFHQDYISFLIRQNRPDDALTIVERLRAIPAKRAVQMNSITFKESDQNQIDRYIELHEKINVEKAEWFTQKTAQSVFSSPDTLTTKNTMTLALDSLSAFNKDLSRNNPQLRQLFFGVDSLEGRIDWRPAAHDVVLAFYYDEKNLYSWCAAGKDVQFQLSEFNVVEFEQKLISLRELLDRKESTTQVSRIFYDQLLKPWAPQIAQAERLVIVPFEKLYYLPFAVLQDENNNFLGLQKPLVIRPSVAACPRQEADEAQPPIFDPSQRVLAFANPRSPLIQADLSLTVNVANSFERYTKQVAIYTDNRATAGKLKTTAVDADILFIGSELTLNSSNPMRSAVYLTGDEHESGEFTMGDLIALPRAPKHVCFSSGRILNDAFRDGYELQLLASAIEYHQIKSLLFAIRPAEAFSSALLLKRYFRALAEGENAPQALCTAQNYIFKKIDAHPAAWASFMLYGSAK